MIETTPTFVCELVLKVSPRVRRALVVRMTAAQWIYNACLGEALKRVALVRERKLYRRALGLPKGPERIESFRIVRVSVGFTDSALQRYAIRVRRQAFASHIDAHVAQKLGSRAFRATNDYLVGKKGCPRPRQPGKLSSIEGKSNLAGIRWRGDHIEWKGLVLPAIIDSRDPVIAHALSCKVKYVRLIRHVVRSRDLFCAQLVCEGIPYRKPSHIVGAGSDAWDAVALQYRSSESLGEVEAVPFRIPENPAGRERLRAEHMFAMIGQVKYPRPLKQPRLRGVLA